MKKIVALVLSLVMVLGLATTAFAATPAYVADLSQPEGLAAVKTFTTPGGTTGDINLATCTFTLEEQVAEIAVTQTFAKYVVWATNKETKAPVMVGDYVLAASAESADYAFVDGNKITYLNDTVTTWTKGLNVVKVPTVDFADAFKCGEIFSTGDVAVYADAMENLYVESANGTPAYVDGKLVELSTPTVALVEVADLYNLNPASADVFVVVHTYDYDAKAVDGKTVVTNVFCAECKAEFAFVQGYESQAIAKFGAGNYNPTAIAAAPGVYVAKTAGTAVVAPDASTGDKVESAETFDAGIAMYVGMSVMAAAGSAVVLKKKD